MYCCWCIVVCQRIVQHLVSSMIEKANKPGLFVQRGRATFWKHSWRKLCNVEGKKKLQSEIRGKKMFRTKSSFHNPLVSELPSFFPTSNYKEKKCLAFYSSEIYRLYIRTQFGLVMRLRLCISPCRHPNLQLPAHMGALLSRKALRK